MSTNSDSLFAAFLNQHDDEGWRETISALLPAIHEVDRNATRIWFYFYPLTLRRVLEDAQDPEALARKLQLEGDWLLESQIDTSHRFLYGHRWWPQVKSVVSELATSTKAPSSLELTAQIRDAAAAAATRANVDVGLVLGITAVGFATLQHVGIDAFRAAPGAVHLDKRILSRSPEEILAERARDDSQGLFGFLRGAEKLYSVTFDETRDAAKFRLINSQHLTTAAANDKRPYHEDDPRCMAGEGAIPVQCRSAACGTCWVGILGGAEKLSSTKGLEYRRIKEFGYIDTEEDKPLIRLACQAQAFGAVSIVIPPWNGFYGRYLRFLEEEKATKG